jgi:ectoine hydroxylase-related dioxygenase (phytanoyl-CoA dioxygenase family)
MYAFAPSQLDDLLACLDEHGFAVLRGLWDEPALDAMEAACEVIQQRLLDGGLDERYGTTILVDDEDGARSAEFANYVTYATELSPELQAAALEPVIQDVVRRWLGEEAWLQEHTRFGIVYQDARPGRESSYTRIGWHSDWQSGPNLDIWPSLAFTIHIDETSPANGFLRVVPGSHKWRTPAPYRNVNGAVVPEGSREAEGWTDQAPPYEMPLGFDKVRDEIALYCERGDVIFHDAYLWHSAARATDDDTKRRHVRGGWYSGVPLDPANEWTEDFVKNAAR